MLLQLPLPLVKDTLHTNIHLYTTLLALFHDILPSRFEAKLADTRSEISFIKALVAGQIPNYPCQKQASQSDGQRTNGDTVQSSTKNKDH